MASATQQPTANARLIEAVEGGRVQGVAGALAAGADARARKRVTLRASVGMFGKKEITWDMESALALAVRDGKDDIVAALLDAGADPARPIEWNVPQNHPSWSQDKWDKQRLRTDRHASYPSALDLAVSSGRVLFNQPGGTVLFVSPNKTDDPGVWVTLNPRPALVRLLLDRGSPVTPTALAAATRLRDGVSASGSKTDPRPEILDALLDAVARRGQLDTLPASLVGSGSPAAFATRSTDSAGAPEWIVTRSTVVPADLDADADDSATLVDVALAAGPNTTRTVRTTAGPNGVTTTTTTTTVVTSTSSSTSPSTSPSPPSPTSTTIRTVSTVPRRVPSGSTSTSSSSRVIRRVDRDGMNVSMDVTYTGPNTQAHSRQGQGHAHGVSAGQHAANVVLLAGVANVAGVHGLPGFGFGA